jgi:hypothetical protein
MMMAKVVYVVYAAYVGKYVGKVGIQEYLESPSKLLVNRNNPPPATTLASSSSSSSLSLLPSLSDVFFLYGQGA